MNECPGPWSLPYSETLNGCPIPTELCVIFAAYIIVHSWDDPNLPWQACPLPLYAMHLSLQASRTTGWMALGSTEGMVYRLEELVGMGNVKLTFRGALVWDCWRTAQTGETVHRCSDQRGMNNPFSKQTWSPDVVVARDTALATATPFSQRALNMLSSGVCPHTEKVTTKTAFWSWWSSKSKTRKELIFFEHQNIEFNMLLTKPPFPKQGSFVCTCGQPCAWLSWSKLHRTVITCFYVSLSQETMSPLRTSDFPNTVFDMWMNGAYSKCIHLFYHWMANIHWKVQL